MGTIPFAFSVHHFINSVGSDAGFASIIGLAILVLLYFAQARETANLREQAYEASQRVQQLEGRLAQLTRQPGAPQVAPAGAQAASAPVGGPVAARPAMPARAPAVATAFATAATGPPGAPAGVAAPALAAATRLIPIATAASHAPEPAAEQVASPAGVAAVATPPPATAAGGANGAGKGHVVAQQPAREAPARASARATAVAIANGPGTQAPTTPGPGTQAPTTPGPGTQREPGTQRQGTQAPGTRTPRRPAAGGRPPQIPPRAPEPTGFRPGRTLIVLLSVLAVAAVVAVVLVVTSGGGSARSSSSASAAANASRTTSRKPAVAVNHTTVTVAVLNGTATAGLAHRTAVRLVAAGYREGAVATASDQTRTTTIVAYLPGHRSDALAVAGSLKLGPPAVQPIDTSTQAVACPPPATCLAGVVVTVGADLASQ